MHPITQTILRIDDLEESLPELSARYAAAEPFPHIVLDDVLHPEVLERVYEEFEEIPDDAWTNYLHLNERKYAAKDTTTWGPTLQAVADVFASERFVAFLDELTGFEGLQPDAVMDGGGLHRSLPGGFLNVHADFTAHHSKPRLAAAGEPPPVPEPHLGSGMGRRSCSSGPRTCSGSWPRWSPRGNRILLFTTDEHSYHGHPEPLRVPEGQARQSMALYYFTDEDHPLTRSTDYRARPGDGIRRAYIYLDKKALQGYDVVKRRLHLSDGAVSRTLGYLSRLGRPARRR